VARAIESAWRGAFDAVSHGRTAMTKLKLAQQSDAPSVFPATQAPLNRASHLPGYVYSSPEILEREKDVIFMRDWLCVGRIEEIENPGDYMAFRILNEPVVVVRSKTGAINAFSNICQHRGVELVTDRGNVKEFSCPYHGWAYNLEGRLLGAPYMREAEGFDVANCRLPPLQVATWQGWIFVNFDPEAAPFDRHIAAFDADFGYLRQDECRLAVKTVGDLDCNWKLVVENVIDFYHLKVVHVNTNGRFFTPKSFDLSLREGGGYVGFYDAGPSTPSGKPVFGRMPWLADKPDNFSTTGLLPPNFTMFARIDDVHPFIAWPLAPNKTRLMIYTLLPKIYFGEPDFEQRAKAYQDFQVTLMGEDAAMLESLQNVMDSARFKPGRMAQLERGVHHIITNYLDRVFADGFRVSQ
jgi:Rieske 2Fe-2S family protein